jgi:hypothetical protein
MNSLVRHVFVVAVVACFSVAVSCAGTIVFGGGAVNPFSGITFVPGGDLVGTGIPIANFIGHGTLNAEQLVDCASCVLNFETGPFISFDPGTGFATFGGGGSLSIVSGGSLPLVGGVFDAAPVVFSVGIDPNNPELSLDFTLAPVLNFHNPLLESFFGPLPNPDQGLFSLDFFADGTFQNGLTSTSIVSTTLTTSTVPEPASLTTLGLGVGMFLAFAWRKRRHSVVASSQSSV